MRNTTLRRFVEGFATPPDRSKLLKEGPCQSLFRGNFKIRSDSPVERVRACMP